VKIFFLALKS